MSRVFNTAGPVNPKLHYCLDPLVRMDTGKTSSLLALMAYLNQHGLFNALYVNYEVGQSARGNGMEGMLTILQQMACFMRVCGNM